MSNWVMNTADGDSFIRALRREMETVSLTPGPLSKIRRRVPGPALSSVTIRRWNRWNDVKGSVAQPSDRKG
jgi:hypothetical protein